MTACLASAPGIKQCYSFKNQFYFLFLYRLRSIGSNIYTVSVIVCK